MLCKPHFIRNYCFFCVSLLCTVCQHFGASVFGLDAVEIALRKRVKLQNHQNYSKNCILSWSSFMKHLYIYLLRLDWYKSTCNWTQFFSGNFAGSIYVIWVLQEWRQVGHKLIGCDWNRNQNAINMKLLFCGQFGIRKGVRSKNQQNCWRLEKFAVLKILHFNSGHMCIFTDRQKIWVY